MPDTIDRSTPFKRKTKVVATTDLPRVPEGTTGKIRIANGLTWFRYWVDFDNGELVGRVSHEDLVRAKDWERFQVERERAASGVDAAGTDGDADAGDVGAGGGAAGNRFGVPEYLLERSKSARERLGG